MLFHLFNPTQKHNERNGPESDACFLYKHSRKLKWIIDYSVSVWLFSQCLVTVRRCNTSYCNLATDVTYFSKYIHVLIHILPNICSLDIAIKFRVNVIRNVLCSVITSHRRSAIWWLLLFLPINFYGFSKVYIYVKTYTYVSTRLNIIQTASISNDNAPIITP